MAVSRPLSSLSRELRVSPRHSHDHYEETIYSIDGVLTWTVNGKQIDVGRSRRYSFRAAC